MMLYYNKIKEFVKLNPYLKFVPTYVRNLRRNIIYRCSSDSTKKKIIEKKYYSVFGSHINWNNPTKLSEKIQWNKFNANEEDVKIQSALSDKFTVRKWVEGKIGEEYLIPLIGVYQSTKSICFEDLPNQFVIKCSHDSASTSIIRDKSKLNIKELCNQMRCHMLTNFAAVSFEQQYSKIKHRIIIEKMIVNENGDLPDYKFWCFDGIPYYCRVDMNRFGGQHKRNVYDMDWNLQPWNEGIYENYIGLEKPAGFEKMVDIVKVLCQGFPMVRVDLYNVDGKIYFGEMTFSSASGFEFIEQEIDEKLGSYWDITKKINLNDSNISSRQ